MAKLPDVDEWARELGKKGAQYALELLEQEFGVSAARLRELAQADREGRVHIYGKSHKCPICGAYRLVPRVDGQFYFCFHCKNQVTREEAVAALRREQDG